MSHTISHSLPRTSREETQTFSHPTFTPLFLVIFFLKVNKRENIQRGDGVEEERATDASPVAHLFLCASDASLRACEKRNFSGKRTVNLESDSRPIENENGAEAGSNEKSQVKLDSCTRIEQQKLCNSLNQACYTFFSLTRSRVHTRFLYVLVVAVPYLALGVGFYANRQVWTSFFHSFNKIYIRERHTTVEK